PQDRYPSAEALADALRDFRNVPPPAPPPPPVPLPPAPAPPPAGPPTWRRLLLVGAGLLLTPLLVLAALSLFPLPPGPPSRAKIPVNPPEPLTVAVAVRVWSPNTAGPKQGLALKERKALPVRNRERFVVEVDLTQPAHVYLLWLDSQSRPSCLYPC